MFKKKEKYEIKITSISGLSGKDYEENLKEYVDKVGTEKGEPLIVPNENFKKMFNKIIK